MIDEAQDRLEKELNIIKIIHSLRNMKVLMKNSLMSEKVKFELAHSNKNFIDLDASSSSDSSDDTERDNSRSKADYETPESKRGLKCNGDHDED